MLEIGQVLSLKIRYNMAGQVSDKKHPYLILNIDKENSKIVEIAQIDSLENKEYKALFKSNKVIYKCNE